MAEVRRNRVSVLGADRTTGHERDGVGGSRLTFADDTTGRRAHKTLGSVEGKPARAVGACATGKPPVLGHADVWGPPLQGAAPVAILHVYCFQPMTL